MTKIVPIDIGFLYTKSLVNNERKLMKSVVGDGFNLQFQSLSMGTSDKDQIIVEMDNKQLFVSDQAIDQSESIYHSLQPNRFDSMATKALMHVAFSHLGSGNHKAYVVSGLPVSHFTKFKDEIKSLMVSDHHIRVDLNGEKIFSAVDVLDGRFIPQPFGVYINEILNWEGKVINPSILEETWAVWDIGFGTTDVYVMKGLTPVERQTFSTETAMNHAYGIISNKILSTFDTLLKLHEIEPVVMSGKFFKNGKVYDMRTVINNAFESTAMELISEISHRWRGSWRIDHILLAGGGAIHLNKFILPSFPNMELVQDSQWAVINGYAKWGVKTWGVQNG